MPRFNLIRPVMVLSLGTWGATVAIADEASTDLTSALRDIKPIVDMRLRFEGVRQDGMAEDASAGTLRGRLGGSTASYQHTTLLAEGEFVAPFLEDYNSTVNGKTAYPIVSDPRTTELNRLYLSNTSLPATTVILGRQAFALDDSRFVSDSTWRQNEQTYDAVRIVNHPFKALTLNGIYLHQVNRAVGKDSPVGRYDGDSYLTSASWKTPVGTVSLFRYLLDFDQAPTDSSRTTGVHLEGVWPQNAWRINGSASFAHQTDYAGNPLDYAENYHGMELGAALQSYALTLGAETFTGNGVKGLSAPLGSNHKFQGWTDRFASTPANGLENRYVAFVYSGKSRAGLDSYSFTIKHHSFDAEHTAQHYGSEWGVQLQGKIGHVNSALKYADYHADTFSRDTRKTWAQVEYAW